MSKKEVEEEEKTNGYQKKAEDINEEKFSQKPDKPSVKKKSGSSKHGRIFCCKSHSDEVKPQLTRVGFFELFRFADKLDVLLMLVGSLFMIILGVLVPTNIFFFGNLLTSFLDFEMVQFTNSTNLTGCLGSRLTKTHDEDEVLTSEGILEVILKDYLYVLMIFALVAFATSYLGITFWTWTGERQIRRIRHSYFQSLMRQSIGWFDIHKTGELNARTVVDMGRLSDAFGDQMATLVDMLSTFVTGYVVALYVNWQLTLVVLTACPVMILVFASVNRFMVALVKKELKAYAKAGAIAEETFSSIRTVAAYGGEKIAEARFVKHLQEAMQRGVRKATIGGSISGMFWLIIYCVTALTAWYGVKTLQENCLEPGAVMQVFFGIFLGSLAFGNAVPCLEIVNTARASATAIFQTIDAAVDVDNSSEEGDKPEELQGNVKFESVGFSYPSRKEVKVLKELSFSVKKGQTIALVGESGCGKSTTIQLIQRFYDTDEGNILIDGKNLKEYNLTWLRNYMGIVSQEPVLFATTIGENIRLGAKWGCDVTQEQLEAAAKQANCYDFISKLPKGFETLVGEQGVQLSGGQKQRVAIARALIRNPAILLLDEATSALDTQSEALVQDALDKASKGRTTIVIAHRLSTVRGADKILAFRNGKVHEEGTHDELMAMKGVYHSLVMRQVDEEKEDTTHQPQVDDREPDLTLPKDQVTQEFSTDRSSSIRRSKRLGSKKIVKDAIPNPNFAEMLQGEKSGEFGEIELEDGVVIVKEPAHIKKEKMVPDISMLDIILMNKPEWYLLVIGSAAAMIAGAIQISFAVLLSQLILILSETDVEIQKKRSEALAGWFVFTGVFSAIVTIIQNACFALSGERLTMRLRKLSFAAIVRQEMAFFDEQENAVGLLASRLAADASLVKGAAGQRMGVLIQAFAAVVGAMIIAFLHLWELTLAVFIFIPIIVAGNRFHQRLLKGNAAAEKNGVEEGEKMAQEAITAMRTVTSLNRQRYFTDKLYLHFKKLYKAFLSKYFASAVVFAVSQSIIFVVYAVCIGFGGYLIVCGCLPWRSEPLRFYQVYRVFAAITFGARAVGNNFSRLPDFPRAKMAAFKIKQLLNKKSSINPASTQGCIPDQIDGEICYKDVEFSYPTRPTSQVLQGVSLTVKKGETVALVGSSGCGKSTSVILLERLYDSLSGSVTIDGRDIKTLNISWLRHQLGLVSQEPILFDASIAENIAYGDNSREVQMSEIIQAATKANAHNFITSLPQGYDTNVGSKGTQLSGGQKQRVAIARALIRNPAILLLDEATSALDTESEKVVQEALDEAIRGRTAIVVAHRLSTIRNADKIGVIDNGKVVEFGTHEELLERKGAYLNLIHAQL